MKELTKEEIIELNKFLEKGIIKKTQLVENECLSYSNLKDLNINVCEIRSYYEDPDYMDSDEEESDYHFTVLGPLVDPRRTIEDFEHIVFSEYESILDKISSIFWFYDKRRVDKKIFYLEFQGAKVKMKPFTYRKNSKDISELIIAIYKELFGKEPSDSLKLFLELKK